MALTVQNVDNIDSFETEYSEEATISTLHNELAKGIQSMKNGDVYTIEEAWEEIDKV